MVIAAISQQKGNKIDVKTHPLTPVATTRLSTAELGDYHYQRFICWAFCDRQSKAALSRNLIAARTDANADLIDDKLQYYAGLYGLTLEELQTRLMQSDQDGVSIAELHRQLAAEAEEKNA